MQAPAGPDLQCLPLRQGLPPLPAPPEDPGSGEIPVHLGFPQQYQIAGLALAAGCEGQGE